MFYRIQPRGLREATTQRRWGLIGESTNRKFYLAVETYDDDNDDDDDDDDVEWSETSRVRRGQ